MSHGEEMIEGLKGFLQDLKDGKPLKATTCYKGPLDRLLQELGLTISRSEGKRIVTLGAVKINGVLHADISKEVFVRTGDAIEVGKKRHTME